METPKYKTLSDRIREVYNSTGHAIRESGLCLSRGEDCDEVSEDDERRKVIYDGVRLRSPYPDDWRTTDWADQFAACIVDYFDEDNYLTKIDRDGSAKYGLEALPYITEVYAQARYTTSGDPDGDGRMKWTRAGNPGYVIEIRNPFHASIRLTDVHLYVGGVFWGTLDELAGETDLEPDEVLLLYRDAGGGADSDMAGMWGAPTDPEVFLTKDISGDWPDTAGDITVELRAVDSSGAVFDWGYSGTPSEGMVTEFDEDGVTSDPGSGTDYRQAFSIGNGNGINMMLIKAHDEDDAVDWDFAVHVEEPSITAATPIGVRAVDEDRLGIADKTDALSGISVDVGEDPVESPPVDIITTGDGIPSDQIMAVITGRERIVQIGELAHIAVLGYYDDEDVEVRRSIGKSWYEARDGKVSDFMMVFDTDGLIVQGPVLDGDEEPAGDEGNNLAVPHAVVLLDRFTTMSPATDDRDNDGDGKVDSDEDDDEDDDGARGESDPDEWDLDEQFVPGTPNLNTMPAHLLKLVLPIHQAPPATESFRDHVVDAIIKYRDIHYQILDSETSELVVSPYKPADGARGGISASAPIQIKGFRANPGFAMIGELMQVVHRGDSTDLDTLDVLAKDGDDNDAINGVAIDFNNPNPEEDTADGIADDREEQAMIASWLMQTCSVRSDIFTAYVVIHGYPAADFSLGPVESAKFFAVFDRSRLTDSSDTVRVLGVFRVE